MTRKEVEQQYKVSILIESEVYEDGTNWLWQILWIDEQGERDGTYWFGDNGEHPTKENAEQSAIQYLVILKEKGEKEAVKNYDEKYYKTDTL